MKKRVNIKNDRVTLTREELVEIVNSAFAEGYNNGVEATTEMWDNETGGWSMNPFNYPPRCHV